MGNTESSPDGPPTDAGSLILSKQQLEAFPAYLTPSLASPDPSQAVKILNDLQTVLLDNNKLTALPNDVCEQLTSVGVLDVSYNNFSKLPPLGKMSSLMKINFTHNRVQQFPTDLLDLKSVQIIYGGKNNIEHLPPNLESLISLQVLDLNNNIVQKMSSIKNLKHLISLDLACNNLSDFSKNLYTLENLEVLNLKENHLTVVPKGISNLKKLTHLFLQSNKIMSIPSDIGRLTSLEVLDIRNNEIVLLPVELGLLIHTLKELKLDGNNKMTFPSSVVRKQGKPAVMAFLMREKETQEARAKEQLEREFS